MIELFLILSVCSNISIPCLKLLRGPNRMTFQVYDMEVDLLVDCCYGGAGKLVFEELVLFLKDSTGSHLFLAMLSLYIVYLQHIIWIAVD